MADRDTWKINDIKNTMRMQLEQNFNIMNNKEMNVR